MLYLSSGATKSVQVMPLEPKSAHPGVTFYIGLYMEIIKTIFLSETTRPKALMFGM